MMLRVVLFTVSPRHALLITIISLPYTVIWAHAWGSPYIHCIGKEIDVIHATSDTPLRM